MLSLKGKWAFITGASRGIGLHIATALANQECNIVLHSRRIAHTQELAKKLACNGISIINIAAELNNQNEVDTMLTYLLSQIPQIDIIFNNAAIMTPYRENPWLTSDDDYRKSFEINVISLIKICNRLVPLMLSRKWGRIVNLTSGISQQPELIAYSISKAAVDKFVRDFAPSLFGTGVMMNLLDPGWLRTDLGGPNAPNEPDSVFPGLLVPVLLNDGISGRLFRAQDYTGKSISEALSMCENSV